MVAESETRETHLFKNTGGAAVVAQSRTHETNTPDPRTMRTRTNIKNRKEATGTGTVLRFVCITSVRSAPTVGIHIADRKNGTGNVPDTCGVGSQSSSLTQL